MSENHVVQSVAGSETPFKRWYKAHKLELAAKRKHKYDTDPEYKQKVKDSANAHRAAKKAAARTRPEGYDVTQAKAAEELGITEYLLRAWAERGWYPQPLESKGRKYFTMGQVQLLKALVNYITEVKGKSDSDVFKSINANIFSNWKHS
jgi:MerR HTH family regulatory protein